MKEDNTQEQLKDLLLEAKNYISLQKEYATLTLAEQLTHLLAKIAVMLVGAISAMVVIVFLGLALVHWIGEYIGNIGLCYAIFAAFIALLFLAFYLCRRKLVVVPFARMMTDIFLTDSKADLLNEDSYDEKAK